MTATVTAASALKKLKAAHPPDLIISDLWLAGKWDDFGLVRAIREQLGATVPAVAITGDITATDPGDADLVCQQLEVKGTANLPEKQDNQPFCDEQSCKIPPIIPPEEFAVGSRRRLDRSRASESDGSEAHATSRFRAPRPATDNEKRPHTVREISQGVSI